MGFAFCVRGSVCILRARVCVLECMYSILAFAGLFACRSDPLVGEMPLRPPEKERVSSMKNMTIINNGGMEIEDNNLENWAPTDWVEVYLGEYKLQDLAQRNGIKFQVHHMGVLFQNVRKRKWYEMDFYARSADTIANVIMPSVRPDSVWSSLSLWGKIAAYIRGDLINDLVWDNLGFVRVREEKTGEFHELMHIGSTLGKDVFKVREWLVNEYSVHLPPLQPFTFDMWTLYNGSTNARVRSSRNCHDFAEEVLAQIEFRDTPEKTVSVYRDSLAVNITELIPLDMTNEKTRRDYQRFLRFLRNHVYESTRDIGYSAVTITKFVKLGLPFIILLDGTEFYEIRISKEFGLNYCRFPMDYTKGESYVPALLNDTRTYCYLPVIEADAFYQSHVTLTVADLLIYAEYRIDEFFCNSEHIRTIIETTVWAIALVKVFLWLKARK